MRALSLLDNVIGLTHTGRSIARNVARLTVVCGGLEVTREELVERRPGRARQMRRMIVRSHRRLRRLYAKAVQP